MGPTTRRELSPPNSDNGCAVPKPSASGERLMTRGVVCRTVADNDPMLAANKSSERRSRRRLSQLGGQGPRLPGKGCFGFSFTLDKNFTRATIAWTSGSATPNMFPTTSASGQPDWTAKFERTKTPPDNRRAGRASQGPATADGLRSARPKLPPLRGPRQASTSSLTLLVANAVCVDEVCAAWRRRSHDQASWPAPSS